MNALFTYILSLSLSPTKLCTSSASSVVVVPYLNECREFSILRALLQRWWRINPRQYSSVGSECRALRKLCNESFLRAWRSNLLPCGGLTDASFFSVYRSATVVGEFGRFFWGNSVFRQKPATFVRVSVDCPPFFSNLLLFCIQISSGWGGGAVCV
jgi:hypothetical protein